VPRLPASGELGRYANCAVYDEGAWKMKKWLCPLACFSIVVGSLISIRLSLGIESMRIIGAIHRSNPELTQESREKSLKREQVERNYLIVMKVISTGFAGGGAALLGYLLTAKGKKNEG
jgi:hypothetical protein